jgi:hypothetical protein
MAFVLKDRVKESTTTVGTGAIALAGASVGFQSFSAAIGNTNNTYYTIAGQGTSEWEVGIGTYTSSTNSLSRDTVLASSNSGSLVSFSAGSKDVFVTYPALQAVYEDTGNAIIPGISGAIYLNAATVTQNTTIGAGFNGSSAGPMTVANGVTVTLANGTRWVVN